MRASLRRIAGFRGIASVALLALSMAVPGALSACASDETVEGEPPPTEIAVDPLVFLGDLPCSNDDGAAKAYVATPRDVTAAFTLASSSPAPCSARVAFRHVTLGHGYTAEVDVYDRPVEELFQVGGDGSGSRVVVDADGVVVAPRWRTRCGVAAPAIALDDTSVVIDGCDPLEAQGAGVTAIVVDPSAALGELACAGDDGGAIDVLRVVATDGPEGDDLLPTVTIDCGGAPVVYDDATIEPGEVYRFRIEGLAEGEDVPRWGAICTVVPVEGVSRGASCDTLVGSGALLVRPDAIVSVDFTCGEAFDAYDLSLDGPEPVSLPRTSCEDDARLTPIVPGRYEGTLRALSGEQVQRTARCTADVLPAEVTPLDCTFD